MIEEKRFSRIYRFVSPYPEECCYSMLARCRVFSGYSTSRFIYELTGSIQRLDRFLFLPYTYALSNISLFEPRRLVYHHSCLPYSAPFLDKTDLELIDKIINGTRLSAGNHKRLTRHTAITQWSKPFLCYCPLCVKLDREKYGETYWHLIHQLPDIWVCTEHGIQLRESKISVSSIRYDLIPAEYALKKSPEMQSQEISDKTLLLLAAETKWLLENGLRIPSFTWKTIFEDTEQCDKDLFSERTFSNGKEYSKSNITRLILALDKQGKHISKTDFY